MNKICLICKKEFYTYPYLKDKKKYCSMACYAKAQSKKTSRTCLRCNVVFWRPPSRKNRYCSRVCERLDGKTLIGESNHEWRGDNVSYRALHRWVERHKGKATRCEHCGKVGEGRSIQWANKSQEYLRDLNDWISLCKKCHTKYDSEKGVYRKGYHNNHSQYRGGSHI